VNLIYWSIYRYLTVHIYHLNNYDFCCWFTPRRAYPW
jgi:hypothetical protein